MKNNHVYIVGLLAVCMSRPAFESVAWAQAATSEAQRTEKDYERSATTLLARSDLQGALQLLDDGLAAYPQNLDLLEIRGIVLMARMDYEQALDTYREMLKVGLRGPTRRKIETIIRNLRVVDSTFLMVHIEGGPATVYLGPKSRGPACANVTMCKKGLIPGRYTVLVERDGHHPVRQRVRAQRNQITEIEVSPVELDSPFQPKVVPANASVLVHGTPWDGSPLSPGEHDIEVQLDGYLSHKQTVSAHLGQPIELSVELAELVRVTIVRGDESISVGGAKSHVQGAERAVRPDVELYLDGQPIALEQGFLRLPPGTQSAVLTGKAPGYHDAEVEIPAERTPPHEATLRLLAIPPAAAPPSSTGSTRLRYIGVGLFGLAALSVGAGALSAVQARSAQNSTEQTTVWGDEFDALLASGAAASQRAVIFSAVAGVSVIGGAVLYWLGGRASHKNKLEIDVDISSGVTEQTIMRVRGRF